MQYTQKSFSVPSPQLKDGRNMHGQTWDDIFNSEADQKKTEDYREEKR